MHGMPRARSLLALGAMLLASACLRGAASPMGTGRLAPPPALDETASSRSSDVAVVAGGCFWGVQSRTIPPS